MKTILVPVDFSDISLSAAKFAIEIAEKSKSRVILLHSNYFVYYNEFAYGITFNPQPFLDEVEKATQKKMDDFLSGLDYNVEVETKVMTLSLIESIKMIVEDEQIDLIVVGTSGSSGLEEFFIGSNTERIVRLINCPVISVPSFSSFDTIRKIMVPINLKEIQDEFMKKIASLQKFFSASIEFVWVQTPYKIDNEEAVREGFERLIKSYEIYDYEFGIIAGGLTDERILDYAMESKANMIAMATHARRGIAHLFAGSVTEDVINHIDIPVWTYKLDKSSANIKLS